MRSGPLTSKINIHFTLLQTPHSLYTGVIHWPSPVTRSISYFYKIRVKINKMDFLAIKSKPTYYFPARAPYLLNKSLVKFTPKGWATYSHCTWGYLTAQRPWHDLSTSTIWNMPTQTLIHKQSFNFTFNTLKCSAGMRALAGKKMYADNIPPIGPTHKHFAVNVTYTANYTHTRRHLSRKTFTCKV